MHKEYTKSKSLSFCYQHINMTNNILDSIRGLFRIQPSFYDEVLSQKDLTAESQLQVSQKSFI